MTKEIFQMQIDSDLREKADQNFLKRGITLRNAIKIMILQAAKNDATPFDHLFYKKD